MFNLDRKIIWTLFISFFILGLSLVFWGCKNDCGFSKAIQLEKEKINNPKKPKVKILDLSQKKHSDFSIQFQGTVHAKSEVKLLALVSGQVLALKKQVGDQVAVGETVAILDNQELSNSFSNAQTALANARKNLAQTDLATANSVTQANLTLKQANLSLQLSQESLENTQLANQKDLSAAKKSIELAELSFQQAEENLKNAKKSAEQAWNQLIKQAQTAFNSNLVFLNQVYEEIDELLMNNAYWNFFSNINFQLKVNVKSSSEFLLNRIDDFQEQEHLLSKENIEVQINSLSDILGLTQQTLSLFIQGFNATVLTQFLDATTLTGFKNTFSTLEQKASANLGTSNSLLDSVQSLIIQNQNNISNYQNRKDQAVINLQNAKSSFISTKARLDTALRNAEFGVKKAENSLEAAEQSLDQAKITRQTQLLNAQSAVASAQSQYNLAKIRINKTQLKSPIAGVITKKTADTGQELSPGNLVYEIKNLEALEIVIELSEQDLNQITIGDLAYVGPNRLKGIIHQIEPELSLPNKKGIVKILLDYTPELTLGSLVSVNLPIDANGKILLPLKAVEIGEQQNQVRILVNNCLQTRQVKFGNTQGGLIEILQGLDGNELIVIDGAEFLEDGVCNLIIEN